MVGSGLDLCLLILILQQKRLIQPSSEVHQIRVGKILSYEAFIKNEVTMHMSRNTEFW